ncbi:MAG: Unknown protein [uncultured Thiotrichaceae bacterium]|uniref:DUF4332 domain-containing protein n=1 Tax=uncultured Thiotrichaceae bacterium TaxID=298394 RepID=A0A6S6SA10_9GAMM|nr:MAG: Unknown protein [uncultured Thiotrichaceae bacterium]
MAAAGTIAATSLTNNDDKDTDVTLEQPESGIENMELSDVDTSIELANADINGDQLSDLETSNAEQLAVDATNPLDKGIESSEANFEDMSTEADDSELTTDTEPAEQAEFVLDSDPSPSDNDDAQAPDSDDVSLTGSIATAAAAATAGAATLAASKITSTSDDANNEPSSTGQASSIEGLYSDNLQVFEGIGPKMEEILKSHHINTWDDLSQQSELGIRNTLGTYGDQYQGVENVDSWITQAKLASNGELRELIERQKEDGISKIERLFGSSALEQASNATSDQQSIEAASNNADNATSTADAESTSSLEATSAVSSLSTLAAFQNIRSIDSINDEMSELNLMAGEVLELNHQEYGKLGPLHCGVTLHGFISVVGDVATVEDKQTLFFSRNNISVHRDEDTFTFIKWLKETS